MEKSTRGTRGLSGWVSLALVVLLVTGCPRPQSSTPSEIPQASRIIELKLVVVGEPELAAEIRRRWNAEDRFSLTVVELPESELVERKRVLDADVDAIVYPLQQEVPLIEAGQLIEFPESSLQSLEFNEAGLLPHFRPSAMRVDGKQYSLPLGSPQLLWLSSPDLIEAVKSRANQAPASVNIWDWEMIETGLVQNPESQGKVGIPDSGDWLAWALVARAVSQMKSPDEPAVFFEPASLKPFINSVPFVEALEWLKKYAVPLDTTHPRTPAEVYGMVARGEVAGGMGWPSSQFLQTQSIDGAANKTKGIAASRLPGSRRRYSLRAGQWLDRATSDQFQFELRGMDGMLVGVTTGSLQAGPAVEFATWLSNAASSSVSSRSTRTGPFRRSHLNNPEPWLGESLASGAIGDWASGLEESHSSRLPVTFPEIAGRERFLERLALAVRETLTGNRTAQESLDAAAADWMKWNEEYGIEKQKGLLKRRNQ